MSTISQWAVYQMCQTLDNNYGYILKIVKDVYPELYSESPTYDWERKSILGCFHTRFSELLELSSNKKCEREKLKPFQWSNWKESTNEEILVIDLTHRIPTNWKIFKLYDKNDGSCSDVLDLIKEKYPNFTIPDDCDEDHLDKVMCEIHENIRTIIESGSEKELKKEKQTPFTWGFKKVKRNPPTKCPAKTEPCSNIPTSPSPEVCSPMPGACSNIPAIHLSGPCSPLPEVCSPLPGACSPLPGACSPLPEVCSPLPGACSNIPAIPLSGPCSPLPGACCPLPGACSPLPGACSPLPGACSPLPEVCSPLPGACSPLPGACSNIPAIPLQGACSNISTSPAPELCSNPRTNWDIYQLSQKHAVSNYKSIVKTLQKDYSVDLCKAFKSRQKGLEQRVRLVCRKISFYVNHNQSSEIAKEKRTQFTWRDEESSDSNKTLTPSPPEVCSTIPAIPSPEACSNIPTGPLSGPCSPLPGACSPLPGACSNIPTGPSPEACSPSPGACSNIPAIPSPEACSPLPGACSNIPAIPSPEACSPLPGACSNIPAIPAPELCSNSHTNWDIYQMSKKCSCNYKYIVKRLQNESSVNLCKEFKLSQKGLQTRVQRVCRKISSYVRNNKSTEIAKEKRTQFTWRDKESSDSNKTLTHSPPEACSTIPAIPSPEACSPLPGPCSPLPGACRNIPAIPSPEACSNIPAIPSPEACSSIPTGPLPGPCSPLPGPCSPLPGACSNIPTGPSPPEACSNIPAIPSPEACSPLPGACSNSLTNWDIYQLSKKYSGHYKYTVKRLQMESSVNLCKEFKLSQKGLQTRVQMVCRKISFYVRHNQSSEIAKEKRTQFTWHDEESLNSNKTFSAGVDLIERKSASIVRKEEEEDNEERMNEDSSQTSSKESVPVDNLFFSASPPPSPHLTADIFTLPVLRQAQTLSPVRSASPALAPPSQQLEAQSPIGQSHSQLPAPPSHQPPSLSPLGTPSPPPSPAAAASTSSPPTVESQLVEITDSEDENLVSAIKKFEDLISADIAEIAAKDDRIKYLEKEIGEAIKNQKEVSTNLKRLRFRHLGLKVNN